MISIKNILAKAYAEDPANMFLHTGALGWIFSSMAQVWMLASDDKIPKKEKKFLIPQEIYDAAFNIIAFYTVTWGSQTFAKKLASSGKVLSSRLVKHCEKYDIKFGEFSNNIGEAISEKLRKGNLTSKELKIWKKFNEVNSKFENGMKLTGNLLGAILSCNIITPMFKNPIAAMKQKSALKREMRMKKSSAPSASTLPVLPRVSINDYKNQITLKTTSLKTNSSMKV